MELPSSLAENVSNYSFTNGISIAKAGLRSHLPGPPSQNLYLPLSRRPFPTAATVKAARSTRKSAKKRWNKDPMNIANLRLAERRRPAVFAIFNRNNRTKEVKGSDFLSKRKNLRRGNKFSTLATYFIPDHGRTELEETRALSIASCNDEDEVENILAFFDAVGDGDSAMDTIRSLLLGRGNIKPATRTRIEEINVPSIWPSNPSLKNSFRPLTVSKKHTFYCDPCARQTTVQFFLVLLKSNGHYRSYKQSPYHGQTLRTACLLLQDLIYHGIWACKFALVETAADFQTLLVFVDKVRFPKIQGLRRDHLWRFSIEQSAMRGT